MDIADHAKCVLRFESGCVAEVTYSRINAAPRPLWRVLGTEGAILDSGAPATKGYEHVISTPPQGSVKLIRVRDRGHRREEIEVPNLANDWDSYWRDLAGHLLRGAPVPVSGHDGRRTIAVFEAAERSSQAGVTEPVAYEEVR